MKISFIVVHKDQSVMLNIPPAFSRALEQHCHGKCLVVEEPRRLFDEPLAGLHSLSRRLQPVKASSEFNIVIAIMLELLLFLAIAVTFI